MAFLSTCKNCGKPIRFYHKYGFMEDIWLHLHTMNSSCIFYAEPRARSVSG